MSRKYELSVSDVSDYPEIELDVSNNLDLGIGTAYQEYGITFIHDKEITTIIDNPPPKNIDGDIVNIDDFYNTLGIYTFTYSGTDSTGKTTLVDRIVNVIDAV